MLTPWNFKASTYRQAHRWSASAEVDRIKGVWHFNATYSVRGRQRWVFYASNTLQGWWNFKGVYARPNEQRWHFYANLSKYDKLQGWWNFKAITHVYDGFWHFCADIPPLKIWVEEDGWIDRFKVIRTSLSDSISAAGISGKNVVTQDSIDAGRLSIKGLTIKDSGELERLDSHDAVVKDVTNTRRIGGHDAVAIDAKDAHRIDTHNAVTVDVIDTRRIDEREVVTKDVIDTTRLDTHNAVVKDEIELTRIDEYDANIEQSYADASRVSVVDAKVAKHDATSKVNVVNADVSTDHTADEMGIPTFLATDDNIDRLTDMLKVDLHEDGQVDKNVYKDTVLAVGIDSQRLVVKDAIISNPTSADNANDIVAAIKGAIEIGRTSDEDVVVTDASEVDRLIDHITNIKDANELRRHDKEYVTSEAQALELERLTDVDARIKKALDLERVSLADAVVKDALELGRVDIQDATISSSDDITRTSEGAAVISTSETTDRYKEVISTPNELESANDTGRPTNLSTGEISDRVSNVHDTTLSDNEYQDKANINIANVDTNELADKIKERITNVSDNELIVRNIIKETNVDIGEVADRSKHLIATESIDELADKYAQRITNVSDNELIDNNSHGIVTSLEATTEIDRYKESQSIVVEDGEQIDVIDDSKKDKDGLIWLIMGKPTWLHKWWQGKTRGGKE